MGQSGWAAVGQSGWQSGAVRVGAACLARPSGRGQPAGRDCTLHRPHTRGRSRPRAALYELVTAVTAPITAARVWTFLGLGGRRAEHGGNQLGAGVGQQYGAGEGGTGLLPGMGRDGRAAGRQGRWGQHRSGGSPGPLPAHSHLGAGTLQGGAGQGGSYGTCRGGKLPAGDALHRPAGQGGRPGCPTALHWTAGLLGEVPITGHG